LPNYHVFKEPVKKKKSLKKARRFRARGREGQRGKERRKIEILEIESSSDSRR
jgi:hypothetical protein